MDEREFAVRAEAWTRAAMILGIEITSERLNGLIETTATVAVRDLAEAIENCVKRSDDGFLPAPGRVITEGKRLYGVRREAELEEERRQERRAALAPHAGGGGGGEHQVGGWDRERWKAYVLRMGVDSAFADKAREAFRRRIRWVDEEMARRVGHRRLSMQLHHELRRALVAESETVVPRPDPFEGGWQPRAGADPIAALTGGMGRP